MINKVIETDLKGVMESLDLEELTEEEKEELLRIAKEEFSKLPGIDFKDISDNDDENLTNDFQVTRTVLTKNINRLEKLTNLCLDAVAIDTNNIAMLQTTMSVLAEQSKSLKMLSDLQGKLFINKQTLKKVNETQNSDKPNNNLPSGWTVK